MNNENNKITPRLLREDTSRQYFPLVVVVVVVVVVILIVIVIVIVILNHNTYIIKHNHT